MLERGYDAMKGYSQSKLAQVIFTFGLAEQLRGTRVTVNALHPASLMDTKMVQSTFGYNMSTVEEGTDWHVFYPCLGGSLQSRIE